jgi:hypothetical protein
VEIENPALPSFVTGRGAGAAAFASSIDRETLTLSDTLPDPVRAGALVVLLQIFAPSTVPAAVTAWRHDGAPIRTTREIEITAHELGFSVWDAWRPTTGVVEPGRHDVTVLTEGGRVFGEASVDVSR